MAIKELLIKVGLKGAGKATKDIKKVDNSFASLGSSALKVGGAFFAARGIVDGITSVIRLAGEQEKAESKLNAVIKSTGGVAGLTAEELKNMARNLQSVTTFGDEAIIGAQSLLLTFTKVGEDVFPQATETILNMSAAMGTDLQSSTIQLGKALNDPVKGIGALSRVGVQLSEVQQKQIKDFAALGDTASAQKIILEELETQFGGLARETAQTMSGSLEQMTNSIGDAGEALGSLLAPAVIKTASGMKVLAEGVASVITRFQNFGKEIDAELLTPTQLAEQEFVKFSSTLSQKTQPQLFALNAELQKQAASMLTVNNTIKGSQEEYDLLFEKLALVQEALGGVQVQEEMMNETVSFNNEIRRQETDILEGIDQGYQEFINKKIVLLSQQEEEAKNTARLIAQYPQLAEKLGLVKKKTDAGTDSWKNFKKNIDQATASAVLTGASITSTSDALKASGHAAKSVAISFVTSEIMKTVATYIQKFIATTPLPPFISGPLALAAGAAFGSSMGSAIERIKFAEGGIVPGIGTVDSVPAMLTPGELILNRAQQENLIGSQTSNITINVTAPLVDETVVDTIIPAIERATDLNLA